MQDDRETDAELMARYARVRKMYDDRVSRMERMADGPGRRQVSMMAGSLMFAILRMDTEIRERGLTRPV